MVQLKTLFAAVLSLSVVSCSPVDKRDAALVLTDLTAVSSGLTVLLGSVNAYTGDLLGAITIATNGQTLDTAINQATTDATASPAFSTADSASVTSALTALTPQIQAGITAIVNKQPLFSAAGLDALVLSQLQTLSADSDKLGAALQAKVTATDATTLKSQQAIVDASFAFALIVFSS